VDDRYSTIVVGRHWALIPGRASALIDSFGIMLSDSGALEAVAALAAERAASPDFFERSAAAPDFWTAG
jgi:hypothetical protein